MLVAVPRTTRTPAGWDDAALVGACLAGSPGAWEEMVERYGRLVWSVARRCGLREADAEEAFQNVFTIVYQKLESIREPQHLAAWFVRTTCRESYRVAAAGAARDGHAAVPELSKAEAAVWERQHLVRMALRRLGGRCEELLRLLFLAPGPPSYEHIARNLRMRIGSIGPTRARCFAKLERILADMGFEPGEG